MQDIPRLELLDKLAAGWKVRRKRWGEGVAISQNGGSAIWDISDLLKNDWEGEPPEPKAKLLGTGSFFFAVEVIRFPARATITACCVVTRIRRVAWGDNQYLTINHGLNIHFVGFSEKCLSSECINAQDWEIWGYENPLN